MSDAAPMAALDARPTAIDHLVVIGHPSPTGFSHAIAHAYAEAVRANGQSVTEHDLYATGFDPLLRAHERPDAPDFALSDDVRREVALVEKASVIVLVFPIWFGMPPAAIVGYVDRVLGARLGSRALRHDEPYQMLAGKHLLLFTTSGATLPWLSAKGQWYGLKAAFDTYIESIFSLAGCEHEHFDSIVTPLLPSYAAECLYHTGECARRISATLLSEAHRRQVHAKLALPPAVDDPRYERS
ncbi:NAD(P)H-dependent oxidoreductase [Sphingomonas parapaucimobilis]|uniref:NAD(P)H-dependent oxidoreductase n=1 Tax=Sphingomonas parapaucimobilis TaxID=28213 RepID=UPI0035C7E06B